MRGLWRVEADCAVGSDYVVDSLGDAIPLIEKRYAQNNCSSKTVVLDRDGAINRAAVPHGGRIRPSRWKSSNFL